MKRILCSFIMMILACTTILSMNPLYLPQPDNLYISLVTGISTFIYVLIPNVLPGLSALISFLLGLIFELVALQIGDLDSLKLILFKSKIDFVSKYLTLNIAAGVSSFFYNIAIVNLLVCIWKSMRNIPMAYSIISSFVILLGFLELPVYLSLSIALSCLTFLMILDISIRLEDIKIELGNHRGLYSHLKSGLYGILLSLFCLSYSDNFILADFLMWKLPDSMKIFNYTFFPTDELIAVFVVLISESLYAASKTLWYIGHCILIPFMIVFGSHFTVFIYIIAFTFVLKKFLKGGKVSLAFFCFANIWVGFVKKYVLASSSVLLFYLYVSSIVGHTEKVQARVKQDIFYYKMSPGFYKKEEEAEKTTEDEEFNLYGRKSTYINYRFSEMYPSKKSVEFDSSSEDGPKTYESTVVVDIENQPMINESGECDISSRKLNPLI